MKNQWFYIRRWAYSRKLKEQNKKQQEVNDDQKE